MSDEPTEPIREQLPPTRVLPIADWATDAPTERLTPVSNNLPTERIGAIPNDAPTERFAHVPIAQPPSRASSWPAPASPARSAQPEPARVAPRATPQKAAAPKQSGGYHLPAQVVTIIVLLGIILVLAVGLYSSHRVQGLPGAAAALIGFTPLL